MRAAFALSVTINPERGRSVAYPERDHELEPGPVDDAIEPKPEPEYELPEPEPDNADDDSDSGDSIIPTDVILPQTATGMICGTVIVVAILAVIGVIGWRDPFAGGMTAIVFCILGSPVAAMAFIGPRR
jgi:hypothetical protein